MEENPFYDEGGLAALKGLPGSACPYVEDSWQRTAWQNGWAHAMLVAGTATPPAPVAAADDPEWDGTDAAHPAWWRGHEAGCIGTALRFEKALLGQDDGGGVLGDPVLERVRRKIIELTGHHGLADDGK